MMGLFTGKSKRKGQDKAEQPPAGDATPATQKRGAKVHHAPLPELADLINNPTEFDQRQVEAQEAAEHEALLAQLADLLAGEEEEERDDLPVKVVELHSTLARCDPSQPMYPYAVQWLDVVLHTRHPDDLDKAISAVRCILKHAARSSHYTDLFVFASEAELVAMAPVLLSTTMAADSAISLEPQLKMIGDMEATLMRRLQEGALYIAPLLLDCAKDLKPGHPASDAMERISIVVKRSVPMMILNNSYPRNIIFENCSRAVVMAVIENSDKVLEALQYVLLDPMLQGAASLQQEGLLLPCKSNVRHRFHRTLAVRRHMEAMYGSTAFVFRHNAEGWPAGDDLVDNFLGPMAGPYSNFSLSMWGHPGTAAQLQPKEGGGAVATAQLTHLNVMAHQGNGMLHQLVHFSQVERSQLKEQLAEKEAALTQLRSQMAAERQPLHDLPANSSPAPVRSMWQAGGAATDMLICQENQAMRTAMRDT